MSSEGRTDPAYRVGAWLMLRGLGLVFLIAFASLWGQLDGLIGPDGIRPAAEMLGSARASLGPERYWLLPTLCWLGAGRSTLHLLSGLGVASSILLIAGWWPRVQLVILWALYLSLVVAGQDFLSFQWDVLLLESAVVAMFVATGRGREFFRAPAPDRIALLLVWWLVFRLVFESGVVKLTSGDPTWRSLTALDYHFYTQPLPTWTAWYAAQAPEWLKRVSVAGTLALELGAPVLVWLGVRARRGAFVGVGLLQLSIFVTGNFAFFNLLTVAIALPLVDDASWRRILPTTLISRLTEETGARRPGRTAAVLGTILLGLGAQSLLATFEPRLAGIGPLGLLAPLRSVNEYGLFRVMTTSRPEIEVQGSDDGVEWKSYRFRYKPGDPERRPRFVEPHQPRLDWQMWFAALGRFETETWFQAFLVSLLKGSPAVSGLLAENPFPNGPPRRVRARLYDYRFTTVAEKRRTGAWWTRRLVGEYAPELGLQR